MYVRSTLENQTGFVYYVTPESKARVCESADLNNKGVRVSCPESSRLGHKHKQSNGVVAVDK